MEQQDAKNLMETLVSAYVWVASADEGVEMEEYTKFQMVIVQSPFATHFDMETVQHTFKDMVSAFQDDFEKAMTLTKERIGQYIEKPNMAEEIVRVSRAAIVADGQLKEVEETVLSAIENVLGISENL